MSKQSARDFLKRMETDQALKDQLAFAADHGDRQKIVREAGFDFTVEEFSQAVAELAQAAGQELTPEELRQVAGGASKEGWCPGHCSSECSCHAGVGAVM
ncbi:MAG: Nif11-like leader peptide family natural product precursor [Deltaproteobacteria bacterium]|nr:MAG: Nif11-like leader peptide family natural product precursor [Deltaproteobacteria bacterium]